MPNQPPAAEQTKRYTDDERVELIRKFWSFGLPLRDFCAIKDHPSFQDMKRLLCIAEISSGSSSLRHTADIGNQPNEDQRNLIASTFEKLQTQLRSIKEEVELLINSLHHSRPDK